MTWQDVKDYWWAIGILLTLIVSVWNLRLTYRTATESRFINTVTAERVKWIQELRGNISKFCGATYSWITIYSSQSAVSPQAVELLKEIDRLGFQIRLQLNPKEEPDQEIEALIKLIPQRTDVAELDSLKASLEKLTLSTQRLLKKEWEKVKAETQRGKLRA
jgi:hypothetical protein